MGPRPGIVRADTIDLQPQNAPSAQDHNRKPQPAAQSIAPHQAAELRHVQEERHSEEENLSNAWQSANGLSDEPPSDDEAMRDDQPAQRQNGQHADNSDGDGDTDMDDDMMDKISSSPSISDGGYSPFPSAVTPDTKPTPRVPTTPIVWPRRSSSLYTPTPPSRSITTPVDSPPAICASSPTYVSGSNESSPFVTTPAHLPVPRRLAPRAGSPFPFRTALARLKHSWRSTTPLSEDVECQSEQSSSPFIESPTHLPLHFHHNSNSSSSNNLQSSNGHHHHTVWRSEQKHMEPEQSAGWTNDEDEWFEGNDLGEQEDAPPAVPRKDEDQGVMEEDDFYQQPNLVKSASDMELEAQLLPINDPLLMDDIFLDTKGKFGQAITSDNDEDGWETESETQYSNDSFDSDAYENDDDDDTRKDCNCDLLTGNADRFIDSGWGGECLRETEDIDFEFVYALHTFVATVEGQANAQKGDTMVLLDDSNSYWWLVRVVKDSTIGYLPAEHIETPTERLARLNKHRNVDLSQTMLGDTTEKTKNPLKKAMRRRNAKTVTFTTPTYIEPSEYEYTTDDDSGDDMSLTNGSAGGQVEEPKEQSADGSTKDEITNVAPLKVRDKKRDMSPEKRAANDDEADDRRRKIDESRASDEQFDREFSASSQKQSKHGTPRNTDSFFRDESIETRKITLTPNILRDDSSGSQKSSLERGPSLELLEKDPKPKKGDKKEKKPGMLSGLFKRKDKKGKGDDASSTKAKLSGETLRESPTWEDSSPVERPGTSDGPPQRTGSKGKLQKSPPQGNSPASTVVPVSILSQKKPSTESMSPASSAQSTPRSGSPQTDEQSLQKSSSLRARAQESISSKLRTTTGPEEVKPAKVKRAKERQALDVDSSPDVESKDPFADEAVLDQTESRLAVPPGPGKLGAMSSTERLSDSPVHITSADALPDNEPPALVGDMSSASSDELTSLRSSPSPPMTSGEQHLLPQASVESMNSRPQQPAPLSISKVPQSAAANPPPPSREPPPQPSVANTISDLRSQSPSRNNSTSTTNSTLSPTSPASNSTATTAPVWSDAHLRAYMDTTEDIRDLLVVVHDTSGVVPVGMDHPLMSGLFVEERGKVKELDLKLDGLLGNWLAKKRATGTVGKERGRTPTNGREGSRLAVRQDSI